MAKSRLPLGSIRNVKKFSEYYRMSVKGAVNAHFERRVHKVKTEKQVREVVREIEKHDAAMKQHIEKNSGVLSKFWGRAFFQITADTALKAVRAKEKVSAKDFPKLVRATKKYARASLYEDKPQASKTLIEIGALAGVPMARRIANEANNILKILKDCLFE